MKERVSFGTGEYERHTDAGSDSITHLRTIFLQKASEREPLIIDRLASDLFPLYRSIPLLCFEADSRRTKKRSPRRLRELRYDFARIRRPGWPALEQAWIESNRGTTPLRLNHPDYFAEIHRDGRVDVPFKAPVNDDPLLGQFVQTMFDWSMAFNLDAAWCREHAYETLDLWSVHEAHHEERIWQPLPWDLRTGTVEMTIFKAELPTEPLTIHIDVEREWGRQLRLYPTVGTRLRIEERLREIEREVKLFVKSLREFMDRREAEAGSLGFKRSLLKADLRHLDWLVEAQILEIPYGRITERLAAAEKSSGLWIHRGESYGKHVRSAVNRTSKLLGLPLRPELTLPGRPAKGSRSSATSK